MAVTVPDFGRGARHDIDLDPADGVEDPRIAWCSVSRTYRP
jgi:hypothetical protein